jgi:hypothetical protein
MKLYTFVSSVGLSLAFAATAPAATVISTFDDFTPSGTYGGDVTATSGETSYSVSRTAGGFWGAHTSITANANGATNIELNVTVNNANLPNLLAVLQDADGTQAVYRWFTVGNGNQLLTMSLTVPQAAANGKDAFYGEAGTTEGLDLSNLSAFHIQIDPHDSAQSPLAFDVSYNNLELTGVPEPTAAMLLPLAGIFMLRRRQAEGAA